MASSIDMFGTGGEGLGGLFTGIQAAQQQQALDAERQKTMADITNTQAITQQRQLGNEYEEAILGDKIQAYKDAATQKREDAQIEKYGKTGEQFGRMSQELRSMPAAARQARLQQIAQQQGIGADHPLLQQFMSTDPEQLPDLMEGFSKGFYEQSDKARAEKQKRDAMLQQAREGFAVKKEEGEANRRMRRDIAAEASADRRFLGSLAASSRREAAAAKGKGGPVDIMASVAAGKITPEKAIAYYEMKDAAEGLTPEEAQANARLKEHVYSKTTVGKPGTTEDIMGLPSPQQRAATAAGSKPSPTKTGTPTISTAADYAKLPSGAKYMDPQGNTRTKK